MTKKIISVFLIVVTIFSTLAVTASAASYYSTGNYTIAANSGSNVRKGAGTNYSKVGAASKGVTFYVSKVNGSWGYTSSIKCTNGTRSGWVCLDYCTYKGSGNSSRTTYNDVFASLKGSGYSLSQARKSEATSFKKGDFVYVWGFLHDANDRFYKTYGSGTCNMTLSIYRPDGSCAHSYTYKNCDNNWIGQKLDQAGTWKIQSKITGALTGTNTRTITVKNTTSSTVNPTGISLNYGSVTLSKGATSGISATVYPSNATNKSVTWSSSNTSVVSVNKGILYANGLGTATITAKTANGKTATCKVTVTGVVINGTYYMNSFYTSPCVGDIHYLSATSYPSSSKFTWSSSNPNVVSITSSGKMTAKSAGTAIITARTPDGKSGSVKITVRGVNYWRTGNFDSGYTAKGYTTVKLNTNKGNGYIYIYTYDQFGRKTNGKIHVTLRDINGNWICEFDTTSGTKLKLGNDHDAYRVYIAKKKYPNNVIGQGDDFINTGKCVSWAINANANCYI